jgi:hypothetical protein
MKEEGRNGGRKGRRKEGRKEGREGGNGKASYRLGENIAVHIFDKDLISRTFNNVQNNK